MIYGTHASTRALWSFFLLWDNDNDHQTIIRNYRHNPTCGPPCLVLEVILEKILLYHATTWCKSVSATAPRSATNLQLRLDCTTIFCHIVCSSTFVDLLPPTTLLFSYPPSSPLHQRQSGAGTLRESELLEHCGKTQKRR